jgi:hypothetical protein
MYQENNQYGFFCGTELFTFIVTSLNESITCAKHNSTNITRIL